MKKKYAMVTVFCLTASLVWGQEGMRLGSMAETEGWREAETELGGETESVTEVQPEEPMESETAEMAESEPAENETEVPAESEPEEPMESEPAEPMESETEMPTESETAEAAESEPEEPMESETEVPTESEPAVPMESETEMPAESETEEPMESETAEAAESETEVPMESETEVPMESETEVPMESETEMPAESETEEPAESETEVPAESETAPQTEVLTEERPKTETEMAALPDLTEEPEHKANPEPEPETLTEIMEDCEEAAETEGETEQQTMTDEETESETELQSEADAETESETELEREVDEETEGGSDSTAAPGTEPAAVPAVVITNPDAGDGVEVTVTDEKLETPTPELTGAACTQSAETAQKQKIFYLKESFSPALTIRNSGELTDRELVCVQNGDTRRLTPGVDYTEEVSVGEQGEMCYSYQILPGCFQEGGSYSLTASARDASGKRIDSRSDLGAISFVLDKSAPAVAFRQPESQTVYQGDSCTVTVAAKDDRALKKIELWADGQLVCETDGELLTYELPAAEKWQTLRARAVDEAGNESWAGQRKVKVLKKNVSGTGKVRYQTGLSVSTALPDGKGELEINPVALKKLSAKTSQEEEQMPEEQKKAQQGLIVQSGSRGSSEFILLVSAIMLFFSTYWIRRMDF